MADTADQEWRPNGRPQSTVARDFSAALDELFKIEGGIENAVNNVDKKRNTISCQSRELEALEARLRETEARLQRANSHSRSSSPLQRPNQQPRRTPVRSTVDNDSNGATVSNGANGAPTANGEMSPRSPLGRNMAWNAGAEKQAGAGAQANGRVAVGEQGRAPEYVIVDRPKRKEEEAEAEDESEEEEEEEEEEEDDEEEDDSDEDE